MTTVLRRAFRPLAAGLALIAMIGSATLAPAVALAQAYPTTSPGYVPTAVLPGVTCSAACDVVFNANGVHTVNFRISGSGTGIAITPQVSSDRAASPTYTAVNAVQVGGPRTATITATGLYRVNGAGATYVRLHLTAVTGSVTISAAGTANPFEEGVAPIKGATYSASFTGLAPAASATDLIAIVGSATTTVKIMDVRCSGTAATAGQAILRGIVRSTADGAVTGAMTAVPHDSNAPAATASIGYYTANPTLGTTVGSVRNDVIQLPVVTSTAFGNNVLEWQFGGDTEMQEVILRGTAQSFAINGNGASFPATSVLSCSVTWTET